MGLRKFLKISSGLTAVLTAAILSIVSPAMAQATDAAAVPPDYSTAYKSATYYFLLFFLVCVFIAIIGRIMKLYDLNRKLQGKKTSVSWNRIHGALFGISLILGLYGTYWSYTVQGGMSHSISASFHGEKIDSMFNVTLVITTIVFILTHIALFGFALKYPGSNKKKAYFYPHNNALERWWTIIPAIVLTALVLLGFITWRNITNIPEAEQKKALAIEVTGEQFKWNVRYAGNDNLIGRKNYKLIAGSNVLGIDYSDKKSWDDQMADEIVLPVGYSVRFSITSKDILHSFYMPAFRVQINAVPGMPTAFQFTPKYTTAQMREMRNDPKYDYILLCAKICGASHFNMQKKVTVVSVEEYKTWLAKQPFYYNDEAKKELKLVEQKKSIVENKLALTN